MVPPNDAACKNHQPNKHANDQHAKVDPVPSGNHQRRAADFPFQFAPCDYATGKRQAADENANEDLDAMD